ncbi:TonB-dependent receptor [Arenicella chitinivorans]|uniref:TonB-dependent receptor n=1 Tax=Arenicella chitinivorans TaxID=1329800 RepID=A0A918VK16_9GAMM|nr:TonB-dependent receptor [Arenicella chitinivorans]GHA02480.1 TonB-dependent receptor [Arenicella chitinivorans]
MTIPVKSTLAAACLLAASSVHANSDIPTSPRDQIVVTAKGGQAWNEALHTAHIFTLEDIESAQVADIPELLAAISGVNVIESGGRGSATSVFVRGVSGSQTIVLIDGVRVGSATLGEAALNSYPIEAIERIEVLKGPFSGIYGADAVGGVIQIFTKKGGDGLGSVSAAFGSHSLQEYDASFNGGGQGYSFHVAAHSEDTDGIDRTSILTGGNDDIDSFEEQAISVGGQLAIGENTVAKLSVLGTDNAVEFDDTFGNDGGRYTETKTLSTAFAIESNLSASLRWSTTLGLNEDEAETFSSFPSLFETSRESLGTELSWSENANFVVTLGADYYQEEIDSTNTYDLTERDNAGVYGQVKLTGSRTGLVASLRYDDNSAYETNTNGSIAGSFNLTDDVRLVASYGTAFVAPSFNYLYFPGFGNPDILPEESASTELSLVGEHRNLNWRVSAYQTEIENLFSFDSNTFLAANIGEAELEGIEAELGTSVADWQLKLNLDLLSATNKDTDVELDGRAEQNFAATASRRFDKLEARFDLRAQRGLYDRSGTELPSYGLFDIGVVYQLNDQLRVSAKVENALDKDYTLNLVNSVDRYNTEGRTARISVRYSF